MSTVDQQATQLFLSPADVTTVDSRGLMTRSPRGSCLWFAWFKDRESSRYLSTVPDTIHACENGYKTRTTHGRQETDPAQDTRACQESIRLLISSVASVVHYRSQGQDESSGRLWNPDERLQGIHQRSSSGFHRLWISSWRTLLSSCVLVSSRSTVVILFLFPFVLIRISGMPWL